MSVHQIQARQPAGVHLLAGARLAAGAQLAIVGFYVGGAVVPAALQGLFPLAGADDNVQLWSRSASLPIQLLHLVAFFAASVGLVITLACVPMCLTVLARHWARHRAAAKAMLAGAAVLGIGFLAFSATSYGFALRDWLAA